MKKSTLLGVVVLGLALASLPRTCGAHVLATDGTIGAVMHMDPNDDPIANQPAAFYFEFKDKQNKFTPGACNCTFSLLKNNSTVYTQPLFQNNAAPSLTSSSVFYTFPQSAVYTVQVTGQPLVTGAFQPFTLTYDIRVEPGPGSTPTPTTPWLSEHAFHLILIGGAVVFMAFFILKERRGRKALVLFLLALLLQHEHALPGTAIPDHPCCVQPSFDTPAPPALTQPIFIAIALSNETPVMLPAEVQALFYNKSPPVS